MDRDDINLLKAFIFLLYPAAYFYIVGTVFPYRGPVTLDIASMVVPDANAVPIAFLSTVAYPLPLYLYYFCAIYIRHTFPVGIYRREYFFFLPPLLTVPATFVCLWVISHTVPYYPSSLLNPLPLASAVYTLMRGLLVPFTTAYYMTGIAMVTTLYNPSLWRFVFAGYIFVFIAYIFPIFQWLIAYFGIKKCVVPLRELIQFKKVMRPEGRQGYRDVVGVDKLPDPAGPPSFLAEDDGAGAGAGAGVVAGASARAGASTLQKAKNSLFPFPAISNYMYWYGDQYLRDEARARINRLDSEPIADEYMKKAKEVLRDLYSLVEAEGLKLTRDNWQQLIKYLDGYIVFAAIIEFLHPRLMDNKVMLHNDLRSLGMLLLKAEDVFQDRVILLTAYVTFTADVLFEEFRRQGLTRARSKEEFIEERINAARGFLSPKVLLRPEGCRTDMEERG
jgi:hypothetical protein